MRAPPPGHRGDPGPTCSWPVIAGIRLICTSFPSATRPRVHVSNILRKLNAWSRIEAGEIGQRVALHR